MLDAVEEVLVCDVVVPVKDVLVKLLVIVMLVDEIVRLVKVPVEVVVEGHPFCSFSQHHSFFASDQLNSQLKYPTSQKNHIVDVMVVVTTVTVDVVPVTELSVMLVDVEPVEVLEVDLLLVVVLDCVVDVLKVEVAVVVEVELTVTLVNVLVRLVLVPVEVVVEGQPFCSLSQHHSFFTSDQAASQLLYPTSQSNHSVVVFVVVVIVTDVAVEVTEVCVLLAEVLVVEILDRVEDVLVSEVDVLVKLDVPVIVVDEAVRVVAVVVTVDVDGQPICCLEQHQTFFVSDQLSSLLL
eukprot:s2143_g14.t1